MNAVVEYDPLLDKRYRETAIGGDVVDFLAFIELGDAAARTVDQYERDLLSTAMGHASIATTYDLYGHLDTRDLVADLALVERS